MAAEDLTRPWVQEFTEGVRDAVYQAEPGMTIYNEFLDAARFDDPAHREELRAWLRQKYRSRRIDLLVVQSWQGIEFLAAERGEPWPGVPVIWGEARALPPEVDGLPETAGVSYEPAVIPAVRGARSLLPDTTRVALVYGSSPLERERYGGVAATLRRADPDIEPIDLGGLAMDDLLHRVAHLPDHTVVLNLGIQFDGAGRPFPPLVPCRLISAAANRPLFSLATHEFGCGVVGGLLRDMTVMGRLLGEQALR
jgi:hypothetical protein